MPTTRLLRYTLSGSAFIFFGLFFFWFLGGSLALRDIERIDFVKIATLILSTPLLGIVISTIVFESLVIAIGYRTYYYVPENIDIIKWILKEKSTTTKTEIRLRKKLNTNDIQNRSFSKELYPFYQIKVRKHVMGRSLSFLERKWAVIWVHRNILGAIIIAFMINVISRLCQGNANGVILKLDIYKTIPFVIILMYMLFAYRHIKYAIKVATDFEHKILMNVYEEETANNRSRNHQSNSVFDFITNLFK